ncbi:MAG: NADH-quinone oxidoreductase subunit N [Candidatus Marsarchaeota archaeon]|nr:NADH-quinone oxidoreductase subunit N [Candidatus Marsarchaeota archaeon]MCL5106229.1 NADH-quinone oxidoreductase subunit N [Candidatus Marsarchaeota archaeon]
MAINTINNISYILLILVAMIFAFSVSFSLIRNKRAKFLQLAVLLALLAAASGWLFLANANAVLLNLFHIYSFSLLFTCLFSILFILILVLSYDSEADYFYTIIGIIATGAMIVPMAGSLITLFLALEITSVATSFAIMTKNKVHLEAAMKMFILSAVSISIFSFAMVLVFPYSPQLALAGLASNSAVAGNYLIELGIALFIAALGFEAAAFPFNLWIPDVYQGARANLTAMVSGINKKIGFVAMMLVLFIVFAQYAWFFSGIIAMLSLATMFFGNLVAMAQQNVKRMLAYSSISQAGYIMIGIAAASGLGLEASIFQIIAHAFMIIGAFAFVFWLESQYGMNTISDYDGLTQRNMFAGIGLSIIMLSLIGIPPLLGFYGKFLLFSSALGAKMAALAFLGIINSFISVYYYGRLMVAMHRKTNKKHILISRNTAIVAGVCIFVIVGIGLYPEFLMQAASIAARALL